MTTVSNLGKLAGSALKLAKQPAATQVAQQSMRMAAKQLASAQSPMSSANSSGPDKTNRNAEIFRNNASRPIFTAAERDFKNATAGQEPSKGSGLTPTPAGTEGTTIRSALPSFERLAEINPELQNKKVEQQKDFPSGVEVRKFDDGMVLATNMDVTNSQSIIDAIEGGAEALGVEPRDVFDMVILKNLLRENNNPADTAKLHGEAFAAIDAAATHFEIDDVDVAVIQNNNNPNLKPSTLDTVAKDKGFDAIQGHEAKHPEFKNDVEALPTVTAFGIKEHRDQSIDYKPTVKVYNNL